MTLSERLSQSQPKPQPKPQPIAADSLKAAWVGSDDSLSAPVCMHCGAQGWHVYYAKAHGGIWYPLCVDREACALRAHGGLLV